MTRPLPLLAALLCATSALAEGLPDGPLAQARILGGWRAGDGSHVAALEITMPEGWHTYWRAPGEVGIPPLFDWSGSEGVRRVSVSWPVPQVFEDGGVRSYGYETRVVLPLRVELAPGATPHLALSGDIGVCKDICVPATIRAEGTLPAPGARSGAIAGALADRPMTAAEAGASARCRIAPAPDGLRVEAELTLSDTGGREAVVIESANPLHWVSAPETTRSGDRMTLRAEVAHVEGRPVALDRSGLRFTVLGSHRAVDIRGCTAF